MSEMTEENQRPATPEETLDILIQCLPKSPFRDRVTEAVADLRAQLTAATKRIEEAEKCEPVEFVETQNGHCRVADEAEYFTRPVPPADVAELRKQNDTAFASLANAERRIAELERNHSEIMAENYKLAEECEAARRKLAEQQAFLQSIVLADTQGIEDAILVDRFLLRNDGDEAAELNKLLTEAREKAVPDETLLDAKRYRYLLGHYLDHSYFPKYPIIGIDWDMHRMDSEIDEMLAAAPVPANAKEGGE